MRYITDRKADEIAALQGLSPDDRGRAIADAEQIYGYIRRSEGQRDGGVPEDAIRKWCESNDIGPDRTNRALQLMRDLGQLVPLPDPGEVLARLDPDEPPAEGG